MSWFNCRSGGITGVGACWANAAAANRRAGIIRMRAIVCGISIKKGAPRFVATPPSTFWRELKLDLHLGAAEFDVLQHVRAIFLVGIDAGVIELLVGGFHLHRRGDALVGIDEREGRVVPVHLEAI